MEWIECSDTHKNRMLKKHGTCKTQREILWEEATVFWREVIKQVVSQEVKDEMMLTLWQKKKYTLMT